MERTEFCSLEEIINIVINEAAWMYVLDYMLAYIKYGRKYLVFILKS